jgi:hypothetical protein
MPTANSSASKEAVTAALLVIGGKILSGRTKDQNIGYIAEYLTAVGINLKEVRWSAMRRERSSTHSMRSGIAAPMSSPPAGSGRPTVTSRPTAWRRWRCADRHRSAFKIGAEMNEARLRLTRTPQGADCWRSKNG